jgi:hypothetical protein
MDRSAGTTCPRRNEESRGFLLARFGKSSPTLRIRACGTELVNQGTDVHVVYIFELVSAADDGDDRLLRFGTRYSCSHAQHKTWVADGFLLPHAGCQSAVRFPECSFLENFANFKTNRENIKRRNLALQLYYSEVTTAAQAHSDHTWLARGAFASLYVDWMLVRGDALEENALANRRPSPTEYAVHQTHLARASAQPLGFYSGQICKVASTGVCTGDRPSSDVAVLTAGDCSLLSDLSDLSEPNRSDWEKREQQPEAENGRMVMPSTRQLYPEHEEQFLAEFPDQATPIWAPTSAEPTVMPRSRAASSEAAASRGVTQTPDWRGTGTMPSELPRTSASHDMYVQPSVVGSQSPGGTMLRQQVIKPPSWPRSWANFSLLQLYFHRNVWANLHLWGNLTPFSLQGAGSETVSIETVSVWNSKQSHHLSDVKQLPPPVTVSPERYEARIRFNINVEASRAGLIIGAKVGQGAYGTVWSASPRPDCATCCGGAVHPNQLCVIKHITDPFETFIDALRTLRELEFLRVLKHPNIVCMLAIFPSESPRHCDNICLVLERLKTDLHHMVRSTTAYDQLHICWIMWQLLRALDYLHRNDIVRPFALNTVSQSMGFQYAACCAGAP